jgi:hypothetical protein
MRRKKFLISRMKGGVALFLFWNRIVAAGSPWITSRNSFAAQPDTSEYTPFLNGFNGVLRTGWSMSAMSA